MELTPQQITDIILQKPYRITAGILEQRNRLQKLRDTKTAKRNVGLVERAKYTRKGSKRYTELVYSDNDFMNAVLKLQTPFVIPYVEHGTLEEPHERSLKNALDELRYLGYSNDQIKDIGHITYGFLAVRTDYGGLSYINPDKEDRSYLGTCDAFAGIGYFYGAEGRKQMAYNNGVFSPVVGAREFNTVSASPEAFNRFEKELNDFLVGTIPAKYPTLLKPKRNKSRRLKKLAPKS